MRSLALFLLFVAVACPVGAQESQPTPGAEVQKLAAFVGTWQDEGEVKPSPFSPGGKVSSLNKCEWFTGGFYVVCRSEGTVGSRKDTSLMILGYDAARKLYTSYSIDGHGHTDTTTGTVQGNTWTWIGQAEAEGKPTKFRVTVVEVSPTIRQGKVEVASSDGAWTVINEGKSTKK